MSALDVFAARVGPATAGPVTCVGGRTQWSVGGRVSAEAEEVTAPSGVVAHEPGEMIVRVRAGTTLAELEEATAVGGQLVPLEADDAARATVGGLLACGRSGVRRLGRGPVRDCVLEVTAVTAAGELVRAGAPLVKNVTGFDLCRLLVGSVGTLAFLAEVVLRCHPRPEVESWWVGEPGPDTDPAELCRNLYRPLAVLWDGQRIWVGLAGHGVDVEDQVRRVLAPAGAFVPVEGPPERPGPARRSLPPGELSSLPVRAGPTGWMAELGVGVVHGTEEALGPVAGREASPGVAELHRRLKERFDPAGRLNPGRSPMASPVVGAR